MDEDEIEKLQLQIDANTKMIEAILSGIFDEKIEYNEIFKREGYELHGKYIIAGRDYLGTGAVSARVCLKTGGKLNSEGYCIHKE